MRVFDKAMFSVVSSSILTFLDGLEPVLFAADAVAQQGAPANSRAVSGASDLLAV